MLELRIRTFTVGRAVLLSLAALTLAPTGVAQDGEAASEPSSAAAQPNIDSAQTDEAQLADDTRLTPMASFVVPEDEIVVRGLEHPALVVAAENLLRMNEERSASTGGEPALTSAQLDRQRDRQMLQGQFERLEERRQRKARREAEREAKRRD